MKKILIIVLVFIFTFVGCFSLNCVLQYAKIASTGAISDKLVIVIDAGHGGIDAGTSAADGTKEKDINLSIALSLYDFLSVCGYTTALTRDGDYLMYKNGDDKSRSDLYNRMDFINSFHNSLLISIHQNHFEDTSEWGMQIWYRPNDNNSKLIADNILRYDVMSLQPQNKRNNKASDNSYYLLYKAKVPSVMVECGFMSNREENEKLKNTSYQEKISWCITRGLGDYLIKE